MLSPCSKRSAPDYGASRTRRAAARHLDALRALLVLVAILAAGAAAAADSAPALNSLYADPQQPDIAGLWVLTGAFTISPDGSVPELMGKYKALYDKRLRAFKAGTPIDDATANCEPAGLPHLEVVPYPFEILQTPGRVTMLYEYDSVVRRIPIGGGTRDPGDDAPAYYGSSVGHWEGATLAIETTNIRADTQVDYTGLPHSDALRISERIRRRDETTLENQITLTDAKAYAKPFTVTRLYKLHPKWHIEEYECRQNNRNESDAQGHTGTGVKEKPRS